jgi:hypothetical protein
MLDFATTTRDLARMILASRFPNQDQVRIEVLRAGCAGTLQVFKFHPWQSSLTYFEQVDQGRLCMFVLYLVQHSMVYSRGPVHA